MMTARLAGKRLGACTDCRCPWHQFRAGAPDREEIDAIYGRLATTVGTCPIVGTASTMARVAEAPGVRVPGSAAIRAEHADWLGAAEATGREAVRLIERPIRPGEIIARLGV